MLVREQKRWCRSSIHTGNWVQKALVSMTTWHQSPYKLKSDIRALILWPIKWKYSPLMERWKRWNAVSFRFVTEHFLSPYGLDLYFKQKLLVFFYCFSFSLTWAASAKLEKLPPRVETRHMTNTSQSTESLTVRLALFSREYTIFNTTKW